MLHGRGSNPVGGAGPELDGAWLVQAVPYLLDGGAHDGAANTPVVFADVFGKQHSLLRKVLKTKTTKKTHILICILLIVLASR